MVTYVEKLKVTARYSMFFKIEEEIITHRQELNILHAEAKKYLSEHGVQFHKVEIKILAMENTHDYTLYNTVVEVEL